MNTTNKSVKGKLNNLGGFLTNDKTEVGNSGEPTLLKITQIHEDKNQPRNFFDETSLKELADSIKARGIKTPISVRNEIGDFYTINHGARRFKAAKLAGLKEIPVFIDNDYQFADQIIENVQRENLSAEEIAKACDRLLNEFKMSKTEIANVLGKSNAYVTQYLKLLNLQPAVALMFEKKQATDITVVNELDVLFKKHGDTFLEFFSRIDFITRASIKEFKEYINHLEKQSTNNSAADSGIDPEPSTETEITEDDYNSPNVIEIVNDEPIENVTNESVAPLATLKEEEEKPKSKPKEKGVIKNPYISVKFKDELYKLDITKAGKTMAYAWILKEDNPSEALEVELKNVTIISLFDDIK